jgi:hypothetical protein
MSGRTSIRGARSLFACAGACLAFAFAALIPAGPAWAQDRVTLNDGTVVEGEIVREMQGYVWIKVAGSGVEKMLMPTEVKSVQRGTGAAPAAAPAPADAPAPAAAPESPAAAAPTPAAPTPPGGDAAPLPGTAAAAAAAAQGVEGVDPAAPRRAGVPRGMVITCGDRENGDMVGVYMVANVLQRAVPVIEKELGTEGDRIVAIRIASGGGYGAEVQKIVDTLEYEYMSRWRTVGWIDTAISAAAMSAHILPEIYFTTQGNYGACTGFYGSLDRPVEGFELEESLHQMEKISARSGYHPLIMRAMQVQQPLSASIDENGNVQFWGDATSGDILVNRPVEILTFNAKSAAKVKFSKGVADTVEELGKAMGFNEVEWVGRRVAGVPWPVSRAEQMQMDFRRKVKLDEDNTNRYFNNYQTEVGIAAQSQDRQQRALLVGRARQSLELIKGMVRNNPAFARNLWGGRKEYGEWLVEQERILRELMR